MDTVLFELVVVVLVCHGYTGLIEWWSYPQNTVLQN